MARKAKTLENMEKNLTKDEIAAREQAEAALLPDRGGHVQLKMPAHVKADKAAAAYWRSIIKRMKGISLLDDLDAEVLGVYCSMLSRRDRLQAAASAPVATAKKGRGDDGRDDSEGDSGGEERRAEAEKNRMAAINALLPLEKSILSYADKLGLTPSGRTALARKRAAQVEAPEPDADLFGD